MSLTPTAQTLHLSCLMKPGVKTWRIESWTHAKCPTCCKVLLRKVLRRHVTTVQFIPVPRRPSHTGDEPPERPDPVPDPLHPWWTQSDFDWKECKSTITPACLRRLYRVGDYQAKHDKRNLLGVAGFDEVS